MTDTTETADSPAEATDKTATLRRLHRIEGQVRGIARMIEQDRYCMDVLYQLQAVRAALAKVEDQVLKDHAASCVEQAIQAGDPQAQRRQFHELVDLFGKARR
ncbi:transcriptional regulator [Rhodothalassium salexigens]|uniref:metal-sensitive transcriptional regulator n=1 Tax=Rhodothalassium salexigens TaxID=1086 RepID=UPI001911E7B3|nr:metal-sensitive transcriptional regulator [Rhodothalassium salexigens]MBK5911697.1 transcriptional regulator [Rhodothalassium salexigens]MBK5919714.1 transcriptional regulator [Rhodothalassium salexigens]